MFNSEVNTSSRASLSWALCGAALFTLLSILATLFVDPFGVVHWPAVRHPTPSGFVSKLVQERRPTAILLGNSRIRRGFGRSEVPIGCGSATSLGQGLEIQSRPLCDPKPFAAMSFGSAPHLPNPRGGR